MEKGTAQYRRSKKPLLKSCYSVYAINCAKGGVPRRGNDWVKHILGEAQTSKVYGSSTAVRKGGLRPPIPPVLRQKAAELPPCRRRRRHACSSLFGESRATRVHGVMTLRVGVHQRVATRGGGILLGADSTFVGVRFSLALSFATGTIVYVRRNHPSRSPQRNSRRAAIKSGDS